MVVMALFPLKEVSIEELLVLLGTGTIVGGAYYWVISELDGEPSDPLALGVALLVMFLLMGWLYIFPLFQLYKWVDRKVSGEDSTDDA